MNPHTKPRELGKYHTLINYFIVENDPILNTKVHRDLQVHLRENWSQVFKLTG